MVNGEWLIDIMNQFIILFLRRLSQNNLVPTQEHGNEEESLNLIHKHNLPEKTMRHFPLTRLRRTRQNSHIRGLVAETQVNTSKLIYPTFILEGKQRKEEIKTMPGQFRYSLDMLLKELENWCKKGLSSLAIFPVIPEDKKDLVGTASQDMQGLAAQSIMTIKKQFPELLLIADVALDPYTSHGQDGIIDSQGYVLNDATINALVKQALILSQAGADILAPSDMMDGRIKAIRESLERNGFDNRLILSYAAKYASSFYGPFREAVGSDSQLGKKDKKTYQMDPRNQQEALHEAAMDVSEGADMVMVKPAGAYLDVIALLKRELQVPVFAYQVSGEYAQLAFAAQNGCFPLEPAVLESLTAIQRAGASGVLSYFTPLLLDVNYEL